MTAIPNLQNPESWLQADEMRVLAKPVTREEWLRRAAMLLSPLFADDMVTQHVKGNLPALQVAVGFPRQHGKRKGSCAIGQCWFPTPDSPVAHIFVCPTLGDPTRVLDVLIHEMVHAYVGPTAGHAAGTFGRIARAIGLEGKLTETIAGPALKVALAGVVALLGPYPHAAMVIKPETVRPSGRAPQSEFFSLVSINDETYRIKMIRKSLCEAHGFPVDPWGSPMVPSRGYEGPNDREA